MDLDEIRMKWTTKYDDKKAAADTLSQFKTS